MGMHFCVIAKLAFLGSIPSLPGFNEQSYMQIYSMVLVALISGANLKITQSYPAPLNEYSQ